MNSIRRSNHQRLAIAAAALLLCGCAGYQNHSDGMQYAAAGNHERAIAMLQEASRLDPTNSEYRIDLLKETAAYTALLIRRADTARSENRPEEAAMLYAKTLQIEPANEKARRGLASLEQDARNLSLQASAESLMRDGHLEDARDKLNVILSGQPNNPAAKAQLAKVNDLLDRQRDAKLARAAAQSIMGKPVTLQFRDANLRMVFEALSRTTGLNVILDRDVRADLKTTIFVKDAAVEDTVDLILLQNQLEKRTLNASTLFIYPATAAKQKEYQDLQVRTFQINNADPKYLQTVLKTVLKVKEVSMDEHSNTLVIRDTPEAIAVAAKVIAAHDVAEPEVMLEVEVLEVSHNRLQDLGIEFPTNLSLTAPVDASGNLTLSGLKHLSAGSFLVNAPNFNINFKLQDTDGNVLASPRIRARNKEKAKILIGDRVPIITNSVTPVASGSSVVTGSVSYQDVGLKLEFEPQVYNEQEVGIKIGLEVSTIVREIAGPNGSLAYQIGTRNANTSVRLRDGETQILGGLISSTDTNTASKIPGLGHLPVVGRLFGNNNTSVSKSEIVMSITPHIIRAPAILDDTLRDIFSGTEGSIRARALQLDPVGSVSMQSSGGPAAPVPAQPANASMPQPRPTQPATTPAQPMSAQPTSANGAAPMPEPETPAESYMRKLLPHMNGAKNIPNGSAPAASASSQ